MNTPITIPVRMTYHQADAVWEAREVNPDPKRLRPYIRKAKARDAIAELRYTIEIDEKRPFVFSFEGDDPFKPIATSPRTEKPAMPKPHGAKVAKLLGKVPEYIRRDGDGYRGRTLWLEGLLNDIVEAAREEGRREGRRAAMPSKEVRRGLNTFAGLVTASSAEMLIGRDNDSPLNRSEASCVRDVNTACEWIRSLPAPYGDRG